MKPPGLGVFIELNPRRGDSLTIKTSLTVEITQEKQDSINILSLQGRLDVSTSGSLDEKLTALVEAGEAKVLVDCRELDYISSAGLRVLLSAAKQFKKKEGSIALSTLNPNV